MLNFFFFRAEIDLPLTFSPYFVLKNYEAFHARISSLVNSKKEFMFFDKDHHENKKMNRSVLLHSSNLNYHDDHFGVCHRTNIYLIEMKMDYVYKDQ